MKPRIVIVGGGFAGLRVLYRLHNALYQEAEIVLVDAHSTTMQKPALPDIALTGKSASPFRHPLQPIADRADAQFIEATVDNIDPERRLVMLSNGHRLNYDYLFLTLGIVKDYDAIAGFREHGYSICDDVEAPRLYQALRQFKGGPIVLGTAKTDWGRSVSVPPLDAACEGPMGEVAFMLSHHLRRSQLRDRSSITLFTPGHQFLDDVGETVRQFLYQRFRDLNIQVAPKKIVHELTKTGVQFSDGSTLESALTILLPPYSGPPVIKAAGLGDHAGFVPTDLGMRHLSFPNIFAAGDVNARSMPKLGHLAILQADIAAASVIRDITGRGNIPAYRPEVFCIMHEGDTEATLILSDVMYGGHTDVAFRGVSAHVMKWSFDSYYFYSHGPLPQEWIKGGVASVLGRVNA